MTLPGPDAASTPVRDATVIHGWAESLPWWLAVLASPWLPTYPEEKNA